MENIQKAIVTLLHYNTIIRDTLEYTIKKKEYNLDFYNFKKRGVLVEIEQNTPLKIFLDKAGENGQKLTTRIKDFYDTIYGDNVDKTSHLKWKMPSGANQVFTDGRVEWFSWKKLEERYYWVRPNDTRFHF